MCLDGLRERFNRGGCQIVEAEQIAAAGQDALGVPGQADPVPVRLEQTPPLVQRASSVEKGLFILGREAGHHQVGSRIGVVEKGESVYLLR